MRPVTGQKSWFVDDDGHPVHACEDKLTPSNLRSRQCEGCGESIPFNARLMAAVWAGLRMLRPRG